MARVVIGLSPLARIAAGVLLAGAAVGIYGRMKDVPWATRAGTIIVCVGGVAYFIERIRMWRRTRG